MSLQKSLKQASVKASRFDVIGNFYRGFQHILQRSNNNISICNPAESKDFCFSRTSALVVVCSSPKIGAPLVSRIHIYLTKTSNWAHEVTSVDSSTWKKHWIWRCFCFIYHLVFHVFRHIWNAPLNSIAGRDIRLMFASLPSPRSVLLFSTNRVSQAFFSNRVSFLLGNCKCDFIWCLPYWGKLPAR